MLLIVNNLLLQFEDVVTLYSFVRLTVITNNILFTVNNVYPQMHKCFFNVADKNTLYL